MKGTLILGAVAAAAGVAYVLHKPGAVESKWDMAIGNVATAPGPVATNTAVQAALDVLSQDAKAAGASLLTTSGDISQKDPDLDAEYLQILGVAGGASASQYDMASVADDLHAKGYFYECGMVLDVINATYGSGAQGDF